MQEFRSVPGEIAGEVGCPFHEQDKHIVLKAMKSIDWLHMCGSVGIYYLARFDIHYEYRKAFSQTLLWLESLRKKHANFDGLINEDAEYDERCYGFDVLATLEYLMPPYFCTINMHLLVHLVDMMAYTGPLYGTWMFSFERYANHLKGFVQSSPNIEETLARNVQLSEALYFRTTDTADPDMNTFDRAPYHLHKVVQEPSGNIEMLQVAEAMGEWQLISKWLWTNDPLLHIIHTVFKQEQPSGKDKQGAFEAWKPTGKAIKQINELVHADEPKLQAFSSLSLTLSDVLKIKRTSEGEAQVTRCEKLVVNDINFCTFAKDGTFKTTNSAIKYDAEGADGSIMTETARIRSIYKVQSHQLTTVPSQWYTLVYVSRYEPVHTELESELKALPRFVLMTQAQNVSDSEPIIKATAIEPVNYAMWESEYAGEFYAVQLNLDEAFESGQ